MKYINPLSNVLNKYQIAQESIAFQSGKFMKEVTESVRRYRDRSLGKVAFCYQIEDLVKKHTNIKTTVNIEADYDNAHVSVDWITLTNSLIDGAPDAVSHTFHRHGLKNQNIFEAFINDKTSRVGGFFAEINCPITLGEPIIDDEKVTDGSVATVILHEVGHVYTFFQYCIRTCVYNVVLTQASQNLNNCRNYQEVKILFNDVCKVLEIEDTNFIDEVKDTANRVVQYNYLVANTLRDFKFLPRYDVSSDYSQDAAEELADIFVARHGGAKEVMEFRAYHDTAGEASRYLRKLCAMSLVKTISFGFLTKLSLLLGPIGYTVVAVFATLTISAFIATKDLLATFSKNGFSTTAGMIKRMQNQAVERLKSLKKLTREEVKLCYDSLSYGDELLQNFKDVDSFMFTFYSFFVAKQRDARTLRQYQDRLESLTANRLFLSSAQLAQQ